MSSVQARNQVNDGISSYATNPHVAIIPCGTLNNKQLRRGRTFLHGTTCRGLCIEIQGSPAPRAELQGEVPQAMVAHTALVLWCSVNLCSYSYWVVGFSFFLSIALMFAQVSGTGRSTAWHISLNQDSGQHSSYESPGCCGCLPQKWCRPCYTSCLCRRRPWRQSMQEFHSMHIVIFRPSHFSHCHCCPVCSASSVPGSPTCWPPWA